MSLYSFIGRISGWLFVATGYTLMNSVVAAAPMQAPVPDGSDAQPSHYMHPLRTWEAPVLRSPSTANRRPPPAISTNLTDAVDSESPLEKKLRRIIVPEIRFKQTRAADAIEFLHQESRSLDTDPDLDRRGVRMDLLAFSAVVAATGSPVPTVSLASESTIPASLSWSDDPQKNLPAPGTSKGDVRITLTMENIPLLEALKYVAQQLGMTVKVGTDQVWLVALDTTCCDDLQVREFRVRREWLNTHEDATKLLLPIDDIPDVATSTQWVNAQHFLESQDVTFPPGASASYLPRSRKLVVRDTQENIDLIDKFLSRYPNKPTLSP